MGSVSVCPRLRWPLDVQRTEVQGQHTLILRCQQGISPQPAFIPVALLPIISRFDGTRTIEEIVQEGSSFGVTLQLVLSLVSELDKLFLLDNANSNERWNQIKSEYNRRESRPAVFAGGIYPSDAEELTRVIEDYSRKAEKKLPTLGTDEHVVGMICPHIDYHRGWKTYASAYSILQQVEKPDVVFLFGTAHQPSDGNFHLSAKRFETPFGDFPAAAEVLESIFESYGKERLLAEEYLHRTEHSLELQLPFLAHRYKNNSLPALVPILVGSFHDYLQEGLAPIDDPAAGDFIAALAEVIKALRADGKRVLVYGGVDLAHMGQHFGDGERVSDSGLDDVSRRDNQLLDAILAGDEQRLFEHIAEDMDRRRICGFPSIYTMLASMRRAGISLAGRPLEYRQAVDRSRDCIVTFASACWTEAV